MPSDDILRIREAAGELARRLRFAIEHGSDLDRSGAHGIGQIGAKIIARHFAMPPPDDGATTEYFLYHLERVAAFGRMEGGRTAAAMMGRALWDMFDYLAGPGVLTTCAVTGVGPRQWQAYLTRAEDMLDGQDDMGARRKFYGTADGTKPKEPAP